MGNKIAWSGLAGILALPLLLPSLPWQLLGAIALVLGVILIWLDK